MKKILGLFLICLSMTVASHAAVAAPFNNQAILDYAHDHLSTCGTMNKTREGLVYLKVSDRYIEDLFPMLQASLSTDEAEGLCKPIYVGALENVGAHISVIFPSELPRKITSFPEKGRKECFTVTGISYVDPEQGSFQRVYYLRVISADLKQIRQNYSLSPLYQNHDFHITIGVVYRNQAQ
ncbi:MAG: hypothetical protein NTX49_03730 [Chlamydiae bacterium]|nr:hypothetical protein [Chlamydiota bacterium]